MSNSKLNLFKFVFLVSTAIFLFLSFVFYMSSLKNKSEKSIEQETIFKGAEEIDKITSARSLEEQIVWYSKLIERVGVRDAQEFLYYSGLPFDGQSHLLNHISGEVIYKEFGVAGLVYCRDYFLSSCYHGFLIRAIGEGGIGAVEESLEKCRNSEQGVFMQCAHAVGHGLLAYTGYANLLDALELCDILEPRVEDFPLFSCHDGVFMENIWAAHEGGEKPPDRWVKEGEYDYPCTDPRIDEKYLSACWSNQPALMYEFFAEDVTRVGEACLRVENTNLREMCFNGLARQIHPVAQGSVDEVFEMCGMLLGDWRKYCLLVISSSDFGVGGRDMPFEICNRINAEGGGEECYERVISSIRVHAKSKKERTLWCDLIKNETWRDKCSVN